jgi:hypothetical protein
MNRRSESFKLQGIEYGNEIPWDLIDGNDVTVIDWSFQPWSVFDQVIQRAKSVLWIDHHKSAIEEWQRSMCDADNIETVLDTTRAGCELAWHRFFSAHREPLAVRLLGRYDVWDHEDDRVLPFQYRMRMETTDPKECLENGSSLWEILLDDSGSDTLVGTFVSEGDLVVKYQIQQDERDLKFTWFELDWNGMKWLASNRTGKGSKFFESLYDPLKHHGMMAFGWTGRHWRIGLYSDREDVDCSAICKANGGGGHKGAAGFQCDRLPFELVGS